MKTQYFNIMSLIKKKELRNILELWYTHTQKTNLDYFHRHSFLVATAFFIFISCSYPVLSVMPDFKAVQRLTAKQNMVLEHTHTRTHTHAHIHKHSQISLFMGCTFIDSTNHGLKIFQKKMQESVCLAQWLRYGLGTCIPQQSAWVQIMAPLPIPTFC